MNIVESRHCSGYNTKIIYMWRVHPYNSVKERDSGYRPRLLGLRCGRALKNQSAGSSKAMRRQTEAMTQKGVKLYNICNMDSGKYS
jgi:hypothetical protein